MRVDLHRDRIAVPEDHGGNLALAAQATDFSTEQASRAELEALFRHL